MTGSEEESSCEDPVSEAENAYLQREAFDAVEDGGDAGCDRVSDAPAVRAISLDDLRRMGGVRRKGVPDGQASTQTS